ncbi:hypothetical protein F5Y17DRAFT_166667 [Xylariaceae sp. FL0594]|nr:hypothetical protein F5Y17DRAFT_166667 [Xylariaceae sp. FL0594]
MLSLILHMCHVYVRKNCPHHDPILFANPSWDGASAAYDALQGSEDLRVLGEEKMGTLFSRLNANLVNTAKTRQDPAAAHIFASELMDLIFEPVTGACLKQVPISKDMKAWKHLVGKVDVICVCANLGSAITAVGQAVCPECCELGKGEFLLAAHLSSLKLLSERAGGRERDIRKGLWSFGDGVYWSDNALMPPTCVGSCSQPSHPDIWKDPTGGRPWIQSITKRIGAKRRTEVQQTDDILLTPVRRVDGRGAVVFGTRLAPGGRKRQAWMSIKENIANNIAKRRRP